jgi:SAM-dependent methyltransferase
MRLILDAVRVGGRPERYRAGPELDWSLLIRLAKTHAVLALVAQSLKAGGWTGVPDPVVAEMIRFRAGLTARNLFLTRQLLDILDVFADEGIEAIPYKGPLLAAYAYGDLGLRPFGDLDIIVSQGDALRARDRLIAEGYRSQTPLSDCDLAGQLPRGYAFPLRHPASGIVVELHWKLSPSCPLGLEALLPHASAFPLLDWSVPCPCPEQLLVMLCVHGAKHAWERLEWICALGGMIVRQPELQWDRARAEAEELGATRSLALGLLLAVKLVGAPVPDEVLAAVDGPGAGAVATQIEANLYPADARPLQELRRYFLRLRVQSPADRLRYLWDLRHPTERDRSFFPLPRRLAFLSYGLRPLRVAGAQVTGLHRSDRQDGARRRQAERALQRQLVHQRQKAEMLQNGDRQAMVTAAMVERWRRVHQRLVRVRPDLGEPLLLEVGSGAHGVVFASGSRKAVGVDPLATHYASLFPDWQGNVPTLAAAGEHLPFNDGAFDVVVCDNVVDHAEIPAAIVAELARVLSPGGLLYFSVNVHHSLYSYVAQAHRAWNAAGLRWEIKPFADHTVHLTAAEARMLFEGLPLAIRWEAIRVAEAKERARQRPVRNPIRLLPRLFFKNAPYQLVAERLG